MPSIRLIRIDDDVRHAVAQDAGEFLATYGAKLGNARLVVRDVVAQTLEPADDAPQWGNYLVADLWLSKVVGSCGYTHHPQLGDSVEITCFTFPGFEGRGYATSMIRELLDRAMQSDAPIQEVIAHTLPEHNASTRVLEKAGLQRVGDGHDDAIGAVWVWSNLPRA